MTSYVRRSIRSFTVAVSLLGVLAVSACKADNPLDPSKFGIEVTDLVVGSGTELRIGRGATVHYTLWLFDESQPERKGAQVETTQGGSPFSFAVGYGQVISGLDIGMPGMRVGGTRRLVIPPTQAYGASVRPNIPANSTLIFELQLIGVY